MHACLNDDAAIRSTRSAVNHLAVEIDYKNDTSMQGKAREHLEMLRSYEVMVRKNTQMIAESTAEALLINEAKTVNENNPYSLEFLLKNAFGDVCHPNAARYMLYLAKIEMDKRVKSVNSEINDVITANLENYSSDANNPGFFDVGYTSQRHEKNLDEVCDAEKAINEDPSIIDKVRGYEKIYDKFNACFPDYFRNITDLGEKIAELAAYKLGAEYLKELCRSRLKFTAANG